jgi:hypothetical protein
MTFDNVVAEIIALLVQIGKGFASLIELIKQLFS